MQFPVPFVACCLFALAVSGPSLDHSDQHQAPLARSSPHLTLEGARAALGAARELAAARGVGGAIAVVDAGGELLAFERLEGTFPASARVSVGKARTAALFRKPTGVFEKIINDGRTTMVTIEGFTPLQGGVPLVVSGEVVGAIGVSGASSAQEDEELALAGAAVLAAGAVRAVPAAGAH